jgi:hypothetical protein
MTIGPAPITRIASMSVRFGILSAVGVNETPARRPARGKESAYVSG